MYIRIVGECFSENMAKEIEAITNYGILFFKTMKYEEDKKIISMPIERCRIKTIKKIFLGTTTSFKYEKDIKIPALIVIRNITSCKIENNFDDPDISIMHILFGLQLNMKDREICIGSVEEDRGKTCYSIELRVSDIDIEISDDTFWGETPGGVPKKV